MCKETLMIICTNSDEAGAPRHVENIVSLFKDIYNIITIFGGRGGVYMRMYEQYPEDKVKVISIPSLKSSFSFWDDLKVAMEIYRLVKKYKPKIIHGHSSKVGFLVRLIGMIVPSRIIFTVHGWSWRGFSLTKSKIYMFLEWLLYNVSRCEYIFVSKQTKLEAYKANIDVSKRDHYILYNCVPNNFSRHHSDKSIRNLGKYVIMPARVSSAKNHTLLLKAFEASNYNGKLVLAGVNTDSKEFQDLAFKVAPNKYDRIQFLGEVNNIDAYYNLCDAVMLCSNFEALPISLLEALSMGRRIVASNVGGVQEVLGNSDVGLLCDNTLIEWISAFNSLDDPVWLDRLQKTSSVFNSKFSENKFYSDLLAIYSQKDRAIIFPK